MPIENDAHKGSISKVEEVHDHFLHQGECYHCGGFQAKHYHCGGFQWQVQEAQAGFQFHRLKFVSSLNCVKVVEKAHGSDRDLRCQMMRKGKEWSKFV